MARVPGVVVALAGAGLLAWSVWSGSRPVEGLQRGGAEWLVPESRVERRAAAGPQEQVGEERPATSGSPSGRGEPAVGPRGPGEAAGGEPGVVAERDPGPGGAEAGGDLLIDINVATAAQFELLPEIGPVMGQRIVDDRAANGAFASVDDLMRVRGIGPKTVEKLRELVVCGGGG